MVDWSGVPWVSLFWAQAKSNSAQALMLAIFIRLVVMLFASNGCILISPELSQLISALSGQLKPSRLGITTAGKVLAFMMFLSEMMLFM